LRYRRQCRCLALLSGIRPSRSTRVARTRVKCGRSKKARPCAAHDGLDLSSRSGGRACGRPGFACSCDQIDQEHFA